MISEKIDQVRAGHIGKPQLGKNELHRLFAKGAQFAERADGVGVRVYLGEAGQSSELGPLRAEEFEVDRLHSISIVLRAQSGYTLAG
jgi:hypothetical protein